jgi:light-regulated signal transduction histidine kinase (bacteriophytochrome)
MNREGAATSIYYEENAQLNENVREKATDIMEWFSNKWRNEKDSDERQLEQLLTMIEKVNNEIISQIQEIVRYYEVCISRKHYFSDTEFGKKALEMMSKAVRDVSKVCEDLLNIKDVEANNHNDMQSYCLLELLQECLDEIDANVFYAYEWKISAYQIVTDKDKFRNHVLMNIKENIQNHAFSTPAFIDKPLWEKDVHVIIEEVDDNYVITIKNNGEKFKGDISMVFDYGYCHGKMKKNGIGMHSARKSMKELGGSIEFISTPNEAFHVRHKLTIPKYGK